MPPQIVTALFRQTRVITGGVPSLVDRLAALFSRRARPADSAGERRQFLRTALASDLEQATREESLTGEQRLAWLVHHLDLYVSRVLAFAALPHTGAESLIRGDLFATVELALEAIRAEVAGDAHLTAFWQALADAETTVRELRAAPTKDAFESLRSLPARLKDAL